MQTPVKRGSGLPKRCGRAAVQAKYKIHNPPRFLRKRIHALERHIDRQPMDNAARIALHVLRRSTGKVRGVCAQEVGAFLAKKKRGGDDASND